MCLSVSVSLSVSLSPSLSLSLSVSLSLSLSLSLSVSVRLGQQIGKGSTSKHLSVIGRAQRAQSRGAKLVCCFQKGGRGGGGRRADIGMV